jgi:cytochrome b subunit of formate dehydrogenase
MTKFIAESSLLWIITAFLFVVTSVSGFASVQAAAPFFELLFEVAMVCVPRIYHPFYLMHVVQMLSPALLTYHVATEYTGNAHDRSSMKSGEALVIPISPSNHSVEKSSYV